MMTRAARLLGPRRMALAEEPLRAPVAHEVRIRVEGCGVCGSNLPVWQGRPWLEYPLAPGAPGHEGWGAIDAVGAAVGGLAVGDRVAFLSEHAFAEHDFAAAEQAVRLPESLAGRPFPGEPLGCAVNILERSDIAPGQTVAIVGIGFIGAALTALAARAGARVIALSRRPFALAIAERMGASACVSLTDPGSAVREVQSLTAGRGCGRVIEAVGSQEALDLASELTRTRARLIIAGYHQDGPRRVDLQQWNWRGLDVINAHERDPAVYRRGIEKAVRLVVEGGFDPQPLITHGFALEELPAAFDMLAARPAGFMKAWLACP